VLNDVTSQSINVRVTEETIALIDKAVKKGFARSRAAFGEKAIVKRLEDIGILKSDELPDMQLISVLFSEKIIENISLAIELGYTNDIEDFILKSVSNLLRTLGIIEKRLEERLNSSEKE
jgi:Arc/MetJ-type ribon-helix-helix transcriptional regulator